ncbi:GroES-like protein [Aulographum hederae CBS 113979]|uniref:GroES-like protein n=1 Tax=Aulographum hederae CBS 113979 TaxID=1176131 RepID=A0A6G1GZV8_9PEZI|nr:GroES-like protein [Aulographum hederae CBS 113979]
MATHKAAVLRSFSSPLSIEMVPTLEAVPGSAIVRVLATAVVPYARKVYSGNIALTSSSLPLPLVPGVGCIGRVATVGPDATSLQPGQLVFCEPTIRSRDNPANQILIGHSAGFAPDAKKLMEGEWRNGTLAEMVKMPLENLFALNEDVLLGKLGLEMKHLTYIQVLAVPLGGLLEAGVGPGTSVVIAPATGKFGGAAVAVALALGARVIAAGRNTAALEKLTALYGNTMLATVVLSGDVAEDTEKLKEANGGSPFDVFQDWCPMTVAAGDPTPSLIASCIAALRHEGTASLMGGIRGDISISYSMVMHRNLKIRGKFMYEREDVLKLLKLIEHGNLKLGGGVGSGMDIAGVFSLDEMDEALLLAAEKKGWGGSVVVCP